MRSLKRSRGAAIIYAVGLVSVMAGMSSLAVDYGHVQLVKSQVESAAENAARYGALGLPNIIDGVSAASDNAVAAAADCSVDGTPMVLDPSNDVQTGIWNTANRTFAVNSDPTLCNAIKITAHRTAARGNAVTLYFARLFGEKTCDVNSTAIAMLTPGTTVTYTIPDTSNPFLSGMPKGTEASPNNPNNSPDYAGDSKTPAESPVAADGIPISAGQNLTFDGINGNAYNDKTSSVRVSADGTSDSNPNGDVGGNSAGSENGIANMGVGTNWQKTGAPLNSLVGVFLDNNQPDKTAAPEQLDFSTAPSRDFQNLQPKLKQIFFIGDGRRDNGEVQTFTVPKNATRLFIATWDRYQWNNNIGSFTFTMHAPGTVVMVQ